MATRTRIPGIQPKCLRRWESSGLILHRVSPASPAAVDYGIAPLGRSLKTRFMELPAWTKDDLGEIEQPRQDFDGRGAPRRPGHGPGARAS